jgi:hypothetical protein
MPSPVQQLTVWLEDALKSLPPTITAVYIEYGKAYEGGSAMIESVVVDAFGFEQLVQGEFDPINEEHIQRLGDFDWESRKGYKLYLSEFPEVDWMEAIRSVTESTGILTLTQSRKILLLFGEHDGPVEVASAS